MKEINGERGGGCCCFCNGNDNGYADDVCNGNNDDDGWLLIASPSWGRGGRGRRINQASIQPQSCQGAQAGREDLGTATTRRLRNCQGLPPPLLLPWASREGGGLAACAAAGHWDGWQLQWQIWLFKGKRGRIRGGGEGELKDGFYLIHCFHFWWRGERLFQAVLFCYCYFGLPFSMQVEWFHINLLISLLSQ